MFQNIKHKPEVSIEYEFFLNNSGNLKFKKVKELFLNIGISNLESDIKEILFSRNILVITKELNMEKLKSI